jgi:membrane-associated protease RseP (regulator of RpoE activity)
MEEKKNVYALVIVIAVVGLLLSCVAGALAGGLVGLLAGRSQAQIAVERALEGGLPERPFQQMPWFQEEIPVPVPEPGDELPPFEMPPTGMRGALITQIVPGTPAEQSALRVGDIITAVDLTPVDPNHQLSDIMAQYVPGDRVTLTVWRSGQSEAILVTLDEHPDAPGEPYLGIYYRMRGPNLRTPGS